MIDPGSTPPGQRRGLGWDVETSYSSPRGALFGPDSFGHTGFTGTSLWIDPETETFVILLTSRLHPEGDRPAPTALRSEVATLAAAAIVDASARHVRRGCSVPGAASRPRGPCPCGIDVLVERGLQPLRGQRVGLVTNHTGRTRDGRSTIDVLFKAPGVKLVKLFSPEHGIRGEVDAEPCPTAWTRPRACRSSASTAKNRKPTPEDLEGLDILVYDIQDIGVRVLHLHHHARPGARGGQGERARSSWSSTGPTRSAASTSRGRSATRTSPRSSPTMPCRSATA